MPAKPSTPPPAIGTYIDNGALQLVEVLGYGGYGVVYRAEPTSSARYPGKPESFAVKCLVHSQSQRQRQLHIREITLHRLASAHRNVVTLHRVIEDADYTFIVMDYCPDGDLFSQILHSRRYLGYDALIKHVFLQLLDAVEHCHSLGIYHRDLKPENILCYDNGMRIGITDFGLATTDKMSQEFRTGSIYHMSQCQGGRFAPTGCYSPLFNDIWSLGIILLNLATGRNPWKCASASDPTFHAYLQSPHNFLPTVLPISAELNTVLVRCLEVDWRKRITLRELRRQIRLVDTFYSDDAILEGSMARCPWEAGADLESDSEDSDAQPAELPPQKEEPAHARKPALKIDVDAAAPEPARVHIQQVVLAASPAELRSSWSKDTDSEMVFAANSAVETVTESWADSAIEIAATPTAAEEPQSEAACSWVEYSPTNASWSTNMGLRSSAPSPSSSKAALGCDAWSPTRTLAEAKAASPTASYMVEVPRPSTNPWAKTPSTTYSSSASESSDSPESVPSLPVTPRATDNMSSSSSVNSLLIPPPHRRLTIDTAMIAPAYYGDDEGAYSPGSSMMHTAVESLVRSPWASGLGAWAGADSFYVGSEASAYPGKTPVDPRPASGLDVAMLDSDDSNSSSGSDYDDADAEADDESASVASSMPRSAISIDASEFDAYSPMAVSPRFDQAAASERLLALLAAPASSGEPCKADAGRSPQSGKAAARPETKRRGSSRFNPIKFALRSLSPASRSRSRSRSASRSRSTLKEKDSAPTWVALTTMAAHAPSPPGASS